MTNVYIKKEAIPIINNIKDCIKDKVLNYKEITECMYEKYKGSIFTSYLKYSANSCKVNRNEINTFESHIMGLLVFMDDNGMLKSRWGKDGKREYWMI